MTRKVVFDLKEAIHQDVETLGGKGRGLAEMASLMLPVPPALTVSTTVSRSFKQYGKLPDRLADQLSRGLRGLEEQTGRRLGSIDNPLLLSIRSGAKVSMPGMMDTILNLGLNVPIVEALAKKVGDNVAWNWYLRFLVMFGETVFELPDLQTISGTSLRKAALNVKAHIEEQIGADFPDDPMQQIILAVVAVLRSWNTDRAKVYRKQYSIPDWLGTAVNIQAMVFGNLNERSGTGVVFSRNVATGEREIYGEFLEQAQGEDIVAGIRTPRPIRDMKVWDVKIYNELEVITRRLEQHLNDVADVEFTVEDGRLYILQVRPAKRTPTAAIAIATQFVWEGLWKRDDVLRKYRRFSRVLTSEVFDPDALKGKSVFAKGLPASPGLVTGYAVFSPKDILRRRAEHPSQNFILFRKDTTPDDLEGMLAAAAIVTATGGMTSHAAVVARGLNKPCIVGCESLKVGTSSATNGSLNISDLAQVSVDATTGHVYKGWLAKVKGRDFNKEIGTFLSWVKETEPPIPEPEIAFEAMDQKNSENQLINDFYISDAMLMAGEASELGSELGEWRSEVHRKTAEILACYCAVAVAGELRHSWDKASTGDSTPSLAGCGCYTCQLKAGNVKPVHYKKNAGTKSREFLKKKYGIARGQGRCSTQTTVVKKLSTLDIQEHTMFFAHAENVFGALKWGGGFGGKPWAAIAKAPIGYLLRDVSHTVFCDHVFDLEHNNGSVFGKHSMFTGSRDRVKYQLDIKKRCPEVKELYTKLTQHGAVSPQTKALFERGQGLGLW